jgi:hypothetical protein
MPVPPKDTLCRLIKPEREKWNPRLELPTQGAFKPMRSTSGQVALSVWHPSRLSQHNVPIDALLIESLDGWGQAYHTTDDYLSLADQAMQAASTPFQVQVEWRPDDADEPWYRWRYAHVQVEAIEGPDEFLLEFRRLLAANSRSIIPPKALT